MKELQRPHTTGEQEHDITVHVEEEPHDESSLMQPMTNEEEDLDPIVSIWGWVLGGIPNEKAIIYVI